MKMNWNHSMHLENNYNLKKKYNINIKVVLAIVT